MKILYLRTVFWFGLKAGGSVGHTSGVINALSKVAKVDVISNDILPGVQKETEIIPPHFLKRIPVLGEILYNYKLVIKLGERVGYYNYIYQRYSGLSFVGAYLSKKNGVSLILEFNSSEVWKIKNWSKQSSLLRTILVTIYKFLILPIIARIEEYNLKNSTLIVVVSASLKEILMEKGIAEQKIIVNPNGVDPESYNPLIQANSIAKKYGLENYKVIGFIGSFGQWHGVVEMARAIELFYRLNQNMINEVKSLMIGDGKLLPEAKKIISKSGYQENVIFTGQIHQSEGPKYLAVCDILLSPHIKNPDGSKFFGSPTKLFEYMAMGKAIIASKLDQIGEVLEHDNTAYLVEPGNKNQLADAMQLLIADSELRRKLGKNARAEVLKKYTWQKHVEKILANLDEIKKQ
ncbi:MAG: glycosyltransferase family 4 protein [Deltaproteobacteria bacterium]|jgi:glycosyltransferase involved in cell wall biosynthesis|nr:glycosyltransferase family 4 protein [Deltaproteobacteria bacterium]MDL1987598.1 glycosyltransferase family 4 protein [Deltaproteobacteria bacterium]